MSVYFIHAEVVLSNGCVAEKVGILIVAGNPVIAHDKFFSDDEIVALKERGLSVVIDKFEKVE